MTQPSNTAQSPILQVLSGNRPSRTPVWFMRQAGRILPEYRALKEKMSFLELIRDPAIGAEVTLMPMRRFEELDAAILFTDLLVPLEAMGVPLDYNPGPVLGWTFDGKDDLLLRLAGRFGEELDSGYVETPGCRPRCSAIQSSFAREPSTWRSSHSSRSVRSSPGSRSAPMAVTRAAPRASLSTAA